MEQGAAVPACDVQYRGDQSIIQEVFSKNTRIIVLHRIIGDCGSNTTSPPVVLHTLGVGAAASWPVDLACPQFPVSRRFPRIFETLNDESAFLSTMKKSGLLVISRVFEFWIAQANRLRNTAV